MDALKLRTSSWAQKYLMKKIGLTLQGYSRSAYRTGFYINELGFMCDAGPQNFKHPSHIFVTHCHGDHIAELPFTLIEDDNQSQPSHPWIYVPVGCKEFLFRYIRSSVELNNLELQNPERNEEHWFYCNETKGGEQLAVNVKNREIVADVIDCDHTVPTVSYFFSEKKKKLQEQYKGLSGREICKLKEQGVEITHKVSFPLFAFICDCSIATVERNIARILQYPYVIVECTFLSDEELEQAENTKHIHWKQLKPYIKEASVTHPQLTFVLIHFSMRYKDEEILDFFKGENLPNVVPWVATSEHMMADPGD